MFDLDIISGFLKRLTQKTVWNEYLWLPPQNTWADFENKDDGIIKAQFPSDFLICIPMTIVIFIVRYLFERYVAMPIGRSYGLSEGKPRSFLQHYDCLEAAYKRSSKTPPKDQMEAFSKQTDLTPMQIERWYRKRRNKDRTNTLKKFSECGWRCAYYLSIFLYGIVALYDKPYVYNTDLCFNDWPNHHVSSELYWYYIIEFSFYCSLLLSLMTDVKRKDFWEMTIHHACTIVLMSASWSLNHFRMGTLVLLLHDAADSWIEAAKMANYVKKEKLCTFFFIMLSIVWCSTRLIIYPIALIYPTLTTWRTVVGSTYPMMFLIISLLCVLQVLHFVWFYFLVKTAYRAFYQGQETRDCRSESEESDADEDEELRKNGFHKNGVNGIHSRNGKRKYSDK